MIPSFVSFGVLGFLLLLCVLKMMLCKSLGAETLVLVSVSCFLCMIVFATLT